MAKKTYTQDFYKIVNSYINIAKKNELVHLTALKDNFGGQHIKLKGFNREHVNFGSCSYLGLESDPRIVSSGIEHLKSYGSQFSSSKTYVSIEAYEELEELLYAIFKTPLILAQSTTIGHLGVIPAIIENNDAIIIDQQAHISMYHVIKLIDKEVSITVLRHNQIKELEEKIEFLKQKHNKVWYFMDGVYSMYGDTSYPKSIIELLDKHLPFHLYVDDSHGMSWIGENGKGFFLNSIGKLHLKMILVTSLAKGFASSGGVFLFPNSEYQWRAKAWGGPLTYSGPQQPATLGCSIASAKIHLSPEIIELQSKLNEKITFCNEVFNYFNLPLISNDIVPIKYIGMGLPKVGINMAKRIMNAGFMINLGIYPAVPEKNSGIRFTLTNHIEKKDIEVLANVIKKNLPVVLEEEGSCEEEIYNSFRRVIKNSNFIPNKNIDNGVKDYFKVEVYKSITLIDEATWDICYSYDSINTYDTLKNLEKAYSNNPEKEQNWEFEYYVLKNLKKEIVAFTYFTSALMKNDMFKSTRVSKEIENSRVANPYFQTSTVFIMGTLITEGKHLWYKDESESTKKGLEYLFKKIRERFENGNENMLLIRDFENQNNFLNNLFVGLGLIKTDLPNSNELDISNWRTEEEFVNSLKQKNRTKLRKHVLAHSNMFNFNYKLNIFNTDLYYKLYKKVQKKNLTINTFALPKKFFEQLVNFNSVDVIEVSLKNDIINKNTDILAFGVSLRIGTNYFTWILGIDYNFTELSIYRQLLYKAIIRAKNLNCTKIFFGLSADEEKSKLGCYQTPKIGYYSIKDDSALKELEFLKS